MLEMLVDENPDTDLDTLLAWANLAKKSLQMWNGFSGFQLVLGQNPNLPNIMTDGLPALHGTTSSEILEKHLMLCIHPGKHLSSVKLLRE